MRRVLGLDEPRMPFGSEPLSASQIAILRDWIDRGTSPAADAAPRPTHWAYVKPRAPELPDVRRPDWVRNPIDRFVLARLEKESLSPSPEAGRETLIRRLSLDLTGLPPSIEEVDAFLKNMSSDAYEKVVDRLLASPHYGEKWARPWLDLARYADTNGYEKDSTRTNWKYRDWVIEALNRDLSFRDFTIEQIAGDMLPNATVEQKIATGFHRNTLLNQEGGVDDEEARWETLVDRVNTTATVWLGSTLGCAQCHNHKFDPFTQKDYYRFLAFFDNAAYEILKLGQGESWVVEPELALPTPEQEEKRVRLETEMAGLRARLEESTPVIEADRDQWEKDLKGAGKSWTLLRPESYRSLGGATLAVLEDGSLLASGTNPDADTYEIEGAVDVGPAITAVRLEVLPDASLPAGGPGRDPEGNFFLTAFELEISGAGAPAQFREAAADDAQAGYEIARVLSRRPGAGGWAIDASETRAPLVRQAVFVLKESLALAPGSRVTIRLKHDMPLAARNVGRFRVSLTAIAEPTAIVALPARLRPVLERPLAERTEAERKALAEAHRSVSPRLAPLRDRMAELQKELKDLGIVTAQILEERPSHERPSTHLRVRGSFVSKGERVYADVPAVFRSFDPLPEDQMPNRLGLARWLVSEENPLVARVTVNRLWEGLFGKGLVETSEDFGIQGSPPSHPDLLDWLATELVRGGWSVKSLLRTIVTSSTYRQSSAVTAELVKRDPANLLLARGARFRVGAEEVRDIALSVSGLLSPDVGGPSVFPFQPDGVWDRPYSDDRWVMSSGRERYRRGLYTFLRRTAPYPSLTTFDAPSRELCTARRITTNTPLQALTTLNDPVFFEAAQHLAARVVAEAGPGSEARAVLGFRLCVSRKPTPEELRRIVQFQREQRRKFEVDPEAAIAVVEGTWDEAMRVSPAELASWILVSNVLLNLDETVTRE
jgi:hypothetical protein